MQISNCENKKLILILKVQEIRKSHRDDLVKRALNDYDEALEK